METTMSGGFYGAYNTGVYKSTEGIIGVMDG